MTETRAGARDSTDRADSPAVALIASEDSADVARAILRAHRHGHDVLVADPSNPDSEAVQFAEQLDATVVTPRTAEPDRSELLDELAATARALDYPGIIVHTDPGERIDYGRIPDVGDSDTFAAEATAESETAGPVSVMVGLPAYNEEDTIADVVEEASQYADTVLVVDDGSDDDTPDRARRSGATVVSHDRNRGYGAALNTAFREAHHRDIDHLVVLDADGQHDPADVEKLVSVQNETEAEIVIGSRFVDDGETDAPLYRRFGIWVVNSLTNLSMGVFRSSSRVRDTQSGFRAYDDTAIESIAESNEIGSRMNASLDILYHSRDNDFDIEEVGTTVTYEVENASNHNPIYHGMNLLSGILKTIEKERPITVLGTPGLLSTIVGLGFGYWTVSNYISTGTFPLGLALTSAIFGLTGIFACFTAIILHSLNQHLDD